MAIDDRYKSTIDREYNKFVESPTRPGEPAIEIVGSLDAQSGSILSGLDYDDIELTASTSTTETYTIRNNATDIATLLVTYQNASKSKVTRAQRTDI